jgi:dipeptidyl aminopeptidase/acylaminoacyl peptidase
VLWRSLSDVAPVSASLPDGGHAELIYPHRREIRTWPSFELLNTAPAEGAGPSASESPESKSAAGAPPQGDLAAELGRALGGSVSAVSAGPSGRVAALWTAEPFPPWYHVVSFSRSGRVMTPETVRISGAPCWSQTGELAAGAFDGIRRGIVLIDPGDGAARWWSRPASASYRLLALGPDGGDALAIRADDDGSARLVRARPGGADEPLQLLRAADQARVQVVTWTHEGVALEGLLALPRAAGPPPAAGPHPLLVFLHGGPVGALACGEHPDLSAWAASGWAVFMPDFRSSGIAGRDEMRRAFRRRGLPGQDPEIGDVLSGVDLLTTRGLADPGALILFGHSYGGYLAGRIIGRDHRFRVAVCCEAVADLRLLDPESQRMQAGWLGGDAGSVPQRWDAASPVARARDVRTPVLLLYAGSGPLAGQGQAWYRALIAAGVPAELVMVPGADHVFSSAADGQLVHQAVTAWFERHQITDP